jgi:hypothetical protein
VSKCNKYIEEVYNNKKVNLLLSKIRPVELQDDLKQEMALALLKLDCKKIVKLSKEGKLINYALGTIWTMGTMTKGSFYKTYKKNDLTKAYEYLRLQLGNDIPNKASVIAKKMLTDKLEMNPNDAHESIIFNKYVEFRSCKKVADYFMIPHLHVFNVVKKTKEELKKAINNQL